jgi:hypothetical protein
VRENEFLNQDVEGGGGYSWLVTRRERRTEKDWGLKILRNPQSAIGNRQLENPLAFFSELTIYCLWEMSLYTLVERAVK